MLLKIQFLLVILCVSAIHGETTDILAELENLKHLGEKQMERINYLEEKSIVQRLETDKLKQIVAKQNQEILELKSLLKSQVKTEDVEVIHLNQDTKYLKNTKDIENQNDGPDESQIHEAEQEIKIGVKRNKIKSNVRVSRLLLPQPQTSTIAFFAWMTKTEQKVGPHRTLILDHVETNSGNAYNHHSGVFTVPSNGIYLFVYTIFPDSHSYGTIELVVNSQTHGSVYIHSSPTDHDLGGSTGFAILYLKQGDICYLRSHTTYSFGGNIYSSAAARTSFSGVKMSQE